MRIPRPKSRRGSALLTAMSLTAIMLLAILAVLETTSEVQRRAIAQARVNQRIDCAQAGLEMAKDFFIVNNPMWSAPDAGFLSQPQFYNPVAATWEAPTLSITNQKASVVTAANTAAPITSIWNVGGGLNTSNPIYANHPELFADLDGDGKPDIYMYIRDNADELPPAQNNWMSDNDNKAYVGAVCISQTLGPPVGSYNGASTYISSGQLYYNSFPAMEALLEFNSPSADHSQKTSGPSGSGNLN